MSTPNTSNPADLPKKHQPFVPETMEMKEFTLRAVLLGLVMTVILGAANAYLGLRAGITIAATYPAAVIGMAVLRLWKGTVLEENIARTSGTIGEGIAAGAIFTIPAFLMAKAWPSFRFADAYLKTTALIMVGSVLGVLFISLVRRGMVEDPELPFPESVAAGEIHKAGRRGAQAAKYLFWNIGVGGLVYILGRFGLFAADQDIHLRIGNLGRVSRSRLYHRPPARVHSVCRRCVGLGAHRPVAHISHGTATQELSSRRHARRLGWDGRRDLALYRAAHRGRWNAGRCCTHPSENA